MYNEFPNNNSIFHKIAVVSIYLQLKNGNEITPMLSAYALSKSNVNNKVVQIIGYSIVQLNECDLKRAAERAA